MTELNEPEPDGSRDAQMRVTEITRLFHTVQLTLDQMIEALDPHNLDKPTVVIAKLNELTAAHLRIFAAEEAFDAQQCESDKVDTVDFEALRLEIGGRLDRLRAVILSDKLS